ncbi:MAG TPA: DUF2171 domain-containing protein [Allosphingosinicella sp.]|jgi:hypothetical protein
MGYDSDDRYGGGERGRDRDRPSNWNRDRDYGRDQHRSHGGAHGGGGHDDRGFFDRAGDELRSWFGDDDASRRREADERRWARERGMTGARDNDYGRGGAERFGDHGMGRGWGNQAGDSWNRDRPGVPEREEPRGDMRGGGEREGWFTDSVGGERGVRPGGTGGRDRYEQDERHGRHEHYGARGGGRSSGNFEGNYGMRAPQWSDRSGHGGDVSARGGQRGGYGYGPAGGYGDGDGGTGFRGGGDIHDPHYADWRRRQIDDLDRDYDEYRREHQSRFEQEFGSWRSRRQGQRQMLGSVREHMDVVGSDGSHVGKVDKLSGDRIILAKNDPSAGGLHHSVPCSWVDKVEGGVTLNRTADQAMAEWRTEEGNRALFERENSGSEGPHVLDRSFSGTYPDAHRERSGGGIGGAIGSALGMGRGNAHDGDHGSDRPHERDPDRKD